MIKKGFCLTAVMILLSSFVLGSEASGTVVLPSWVAWIIGIALVPMVGHVFWVSFKLSKVDDLNQTIKGLSDVMVVTGQAIKSLDEYIRLRDRFMDNAKLQQGIASDGKGKQG